MKKLITSLVHLVFPETCEICGTQLVQGEGVICISCYSDLPRINNTPNPLENIFAGRVPFVNTESLLYFSKGSSTQKLIHSLKYTGRHQIGTELGRMLGYKLLNSPINEIDMIVPVPLYTRKLKSRGYNQSEIIAHGIAQVLKKPVVNDLLIRYVRGISQTRKNRFDRWLNVQRSFVIEKPCLFMQKHILLVDDVVTTGATLESCAQVLIEQCDVKISFATIAMASDL